MNANLMTIALLMVTLESLSPAIAEPVFQFEQIARTGEQAADQPAGVTYLTMTNSAVINMWGPSESSADYNRCRHVQTARFNWSRRHRHWSEPRHRQGRRATPGRSRLQRMCRRKID